MRDTRRVTRIFIAAAAVNAAAALALAALGQWLGAVIILLCVGMLLVAIKNVKNAGG